ncbi:neuromedin-S isoform X1 [Coturnix japonica]|uniref:neuromedin-S isoform X1 n=1 Tax=Coturnix japonica TaxID=93934 RepID=UPI0013A5EE60|nr:neuromedin-S isoform X1 [Coturnix japonica]
MMWTATPLTSALYFASNWRCASVSGWSCPASPRSPALFWIFVIPYSTACKPMRNHRLLLQSLQRRIVMGLWDGLFSFSGLEMEELLKAVNTMEYEVCGSTYQLNNLVYTKTRDFLLHCLLCD